MSRGQHAADDNSFNRSASGAVLRGVALIVVAVVLGIVLLQATDDPLPLDTAGGDGEPGVTEATTTTAASPALPTTTTPPVTALDPSTITVLVANGAGIAGLAGDVTELVDEAGFVTATPTDVRAGASAEESTVYYTPGFEEAASAVAEVLDPVPSVAPLPDPPPVSDLAGANVVVVAGPDAAP
ncbi:MAG TPA: LytR C-terminal domain-containing protein [Acidimicrobiales bacterium]|nr:LytR C-terminal domain-containing protein [Acidimicrobiales bacterium]